MIVGNQLNIFMGLVWIFSSNQLHLISVLIFNSIICMVHCIGVFSNFSQLILINMSIQRETIG